MSKALLKGLALTLKTFFRPPVTLEYPDEKRPVPDRFRGRPALVARADGVAPAAWPAGSAKDLPLPHRRRRNGARGTRSLARYRLDLNRCSFCGLCVEACPVEAIVMSGEYELASGSREPLVLDEGRLLAAPDRPGEERP
ncbi:MAG: NADH-quinone oxidoreductase subunit I [Syntrophaceae bacterium]|nr:NADH-quinone oxidoreductase subunit I [Syntrophaceae bacterium]